MPVMRAALRWLRAQAFESTGANRRRRDRLDGSCAAVLMYHRVLPQDAIVRDHVEPGMVVTPETFCATPRLADGRVSRSFRCTRSLRGRRAVLRFQPRACAITFDDGWRDNLEHALPALEQRGLPATIFVVTERVGSQGAFWPDEVCRRMAPLPLDRQRELARRLGRGGGGRSRRFPAGPSEAGFRVGAPRSARHVCEARPTHPRAAGASCSTGPIWRGLPTPGSTSNRMEPPMRSSPDFPMTRSSASSARRASSCWQEVTGDTACWRIPPAVTTSGFEPSQASWATWVRSRPSPGC